MMKYISIVAVIVLFAGCGKDEDPGPGDGGDNGDEKNYWLGADLSYVNEMEDCGGSYQENGLTVDPYQLFADRGSDLIRLRLWHNPDWTDYSKYADVEKAIARAKAAGMDVLLDFHYSDMWADPGRQCTPAAWVGIGDLSTLGDSIYNYTSYVLTRLAEQDLLPEFVQTGNEINGGLLHDGCDPTWPINWSRQGYLLGRALAAVKDVSDEYEQPIQRMLHIAQPENAEWWFDQASQNGVDDYEFIGISYYSVWSDYDMAELGASIQRLFAAHQKKVMVVETAYAYSLVNHDDANNILGTDSKVIGYDINPQGQRNYMMDLSATVIGAGGAGVIYWEPGWISTDCSTLWGQGSHWDNATFSMPEMGMKHYPSLISWMRRTMSEFIIWNF